MIFKCSSITTIIITMVITHMTMVTTHLTMVTTHDCGNYTCAYGIKLPMSLVTTHVPMVTTRAVSILNSYPILISDIFLI